MDYKKPIKNALKEKYPTVAVTDNLDTAIRTMARDNVSALLIQQDENMVGIITISDILYSLAQEDDPHEIKVSTFMTSCR